MATEKELLESIKSKLQAAVWTGTSNRVFASGAVVVTGGFHESYLASLGMPAAIIRPGQAITDEDEPALQENTVTVTLVSCVPNDAAGEAVVLGSNRQTDTSKGVGLLDLGERVLQLIGELYKDDNIPIVYTSRSNTDFIVDDKRRYLAWRDFDFLARTTVEA